MSSLSESNTTIVPKLIKNTRAQEDSYNNGSPSSITGKDEVMKNGNDSNPSWKQTLNMTSSTESKTKSAENTTTSPTSGAGVLSETQQYLQKMITMQKAQQQQLQAQHNNYHHHYGSHSPQTVSSNCSSKSSSKQHTTHHYQQGGAHYSIPNNRYQYHTDNSPRNTHVTDHHHSKYMTHGIQHPSPRTTTGQQFKDTISMQNQTFIDDSQKPIDFTNMPMSRIIQPMLHTNTNGSLYNTSEPSSTTDHSTKHKMSIGYYQNDPDPTNYPTTQQGSGNLAGAIKNETERDRHVMMEEPQLPQSQQQPHSYSLPQNHHQQQQQQRRQYDSIPPSSLTSSSNPYHDHSQDPIQMILQQQQQYYYDTYPTSPKSYHSSRASLSSSSAFCCCGIRALFNCVYGCVLSFIYAENLHRSFCFGAIDGMLTGCGITAACIGLGYLPIHSVSASTTADTISDSSNTINNTNDNLQSQLTVIALVFAACSADAICMAVGHVWSTYIVQRTNLLEKNEEKLIFENFRADSKAKLVHMLIRRGMLKMDAMSVADTLEGYPDLFVSALIGDASGSMFGVPSFINEEGIGNIEQRFASYSGSAGGLVLNPEDGTFSHHGHYPIPHRPYNSSSERNIYASHQRTPHDESTALVGQRSEPLLRFRESYGPYDEYEEGPEMKSYYMALRDGRNEGFFIMIAFSIFAVVPSLIYISVPLVFPNSVPIIRDTYSHSKYQRANKSLMSSISITLTILSSLMFMLGVWKSHYLRSHKTVIGIETVLVFYLCILSAYGIAVYSLEFLSSHFVIDD